jgi:hypothetical protein
MVCTQLFEDTVHGCLHLSTVDAIAADRTSQDAILAGLVNGLGHR